MEPEERKNSKIRVLIPLFVISALIFLSVLIYRSLTSPQNTNLENISSNTSPLITPTPTEDISNFFNYSLNQQGSIQVTPKPTSKTKSKCIINGQEVIQGNVNTDTLCIQ